MQVVKTKEDIEKLENNKIIGADCLEINNSVISFTGENNILYCEGKVYLSGSYLKFNGSNCIIYLSSNSHAYRLDVTVYNNSVFYVGHNNYFNGALHAILSEQKHIFLGRDNLFSFDVWARTADPHLVYSSETHKRINPSKSVFVGDHVWIGQSAMLLKGTQIHSGSILGAMALSSGKVIPSNTSWGGNPARQIGSGVFWDMSSVHMWGDEETKAHESFKEDKYIFKHKRHRYISFDELDNKLSSFDDNDERLSYLKELSDSYTRSRFALNEKQESQNEKKKGRLFSKNI